MSNSCRKVNFTNAKHPLADFVAEKASTRKGGFDELCLTSWLFHPVPIDMKSMATWNAYKKVAVHILACMEECGEIYRDSYGWCFLFESRNSQ